MQPLAFSFRWLTAAALVAAALPAQAQTQVEPEDGWRFQLTPYVWMIGLHGQVRPFRGAPTAHVSQSFSDVLENLDLAAFLSGTARHGRYVLQVDASHASLSDAASLPLGLTAQVKIKQTALTLTGGYNWELSPRDSLDALVGLRGWDLRSNVQLQPFGQARIKETFADPILALRWRHELAPNWSSLVYGDVGGFGVGSHLTWQLMGVLNYQLKDNVYLSFGYRHLQVDFRSNQRRLDFGLGGPVLGATFRF